MKELPKLPYDKKRLESKFTKQMLLTEQKQKILKEHEECAKKELIDKQ